MDPDDDAATGLCVMQVALIADGGRVEAPMECQPCVRLLPPAVDCGSQQPAQIVFYDQQARVVAAI